MTIEICVKQEPGAADSLPTHCLVLELVSDLGAAHNVEVVLQRGYSSPAHALGALIECLSFAPPDLSSYDEGLANLSGLMDRTRDLEEAITAVGSRLNDAEEKLEGMAVPAAPVISRLLPPRAGAPAQPRAAVAPVPSIRQQPPRRTVINAGHGAGGKVNGSPALAITGGVGARGDLGPTGPGSGVDSDVEVE